MYAHGMSILFGGVKCYAKGDNMFQVLLVQLEKWTWTLSGQLRQDFYLKPRVALHRLCHFTKMPHCTFAYCLWLSYWSVATIFPTRTYQSNFTRCFYQLIYACCHFSVRHCHKQVFSSAPLWSIWSYFSDNTVVPKPFSRFTPKIITNMIYMLGVMI